METKEPHSRIGGRDSETGKFIPLKETEQHPATTQRERIPLPGYGDTGRSNKDKRKS